MIGHRTVGTLKNSHLLSERDRLISGFELSTLFGNCGQHRHPSSTNKGMCQVASHVITCVQSTPPI